MKVMNSIKVVILLLAILFLVPFAIAISEALEYELAPNRFILGTGMGGMLCVGILVGMLFLGLHMDKVSRINKFQLSIITDILNYVKTLHSSIHGFSLNFSDVKAHFFKSPAYVKRHKYFKRAVDKLDVAFQDHVRVSSAQYGIIQNELEDLEHITKQNL